MALERSPHPEISLPDERGAAEVLDDAFDIPHKNERLRRWRQAALVLNASRRFRYTIDLKKEGEKEIIRRKIRSRAAFLSKEAGQKEIRASHSFPIQLEKLTTLNRDHLLQEVGGAPNGGGGSSASLGDGAMERGWPVNGNGADSFPSSSSFTGGRGRDAAHGSLVNAGGEFIINIDTLNQQVPNNSHIITRNKTTGGVAVAREDSDVQNADLRRSNSLPPGKSIHASTSFPHNSTNDSSNLEFTNKASASTESDIEEGLVSQPDEAFVHSMQSVTRSLLKEYARLLDCNKATGDVAVAGADSGDPDMLEKMEKILIPLFSFSLPLCVTAYPIVKDLPETEGHLAYGLMGSVPAILFLGLLPTLFTKSPKAGTFAMSAMLLASGIVIGLFTWAWCSLNPSMEYVVPMGVAGALLLCATIILMVAFFLCHKP